MRDVYCFTEIIKTLLGSKHFGSRHVSFDSDRVGLLCSLTLPLTFCSFLLLHKLLSTASATFYSNKHPDYFSRIYRVWKNSHAHRH